MKIFENQLYIAQLLLNPMNDIQETKDRYFNPYKKVTA